MSVNSFSGQPAIPASYGFTAGKNKIINGDFGVWQRGTSFSLTTGVASYTADRFMVQCNFSSGSSTATQQTFTPGTAPVSGYEGQYYLRITNSAGGTNTELQQRIEDVRTFAGQTVTISFWAKASSSVTMANTIIQNFGSGGSASVSTTGTSQTLTTSWARYSTTIAVPSVSGKTIGTSSYIQVYPMYYSSGTIASNVIDVWGVQVEAGATATSFQTATGTVQGELAACQRYYQRNALTSNSFNSFGLGLGSNTSSAVIQIAPMGSMRTVPTSIDFANIALCDDTTRTAVTTCTITTAYSQPNLVTVTAAVSGTPLTQFRTYMLQQNNNANGYLGLSAEL